jgi:tetratricopeptide (TPR) repeat protein
MDVTMEKRLATANDLREAEKYGESAKTYTECLIDLIRSDDPVGLIHCLGGQSLIYKNLLTTIDSPVYHYLLVSFAKEALEIAKAHKENLDGRTISIAFSVYGDALLVNGAPGEALPYFEKSLAVSTAGTPEKGRLKAHIGGIQYLLGEKQKGISTINEALADIRTGEMNSSAVRTWETGVLNNLAKIYALEGKKDMALDHVNQSLKISVNHNLPIRKREAEKIIEKISFGRTDFSI